jgi:hypothetical protein
MRIIASVRANHKPNKNMKLTLKSAYFDNARTINSTSPAYISRVRKSMKRGDGDSISIWDDNGERYDVTDLGRGLELINTRTGKVVL